MERKNKKFSSLKNQGLVFSGVKSFRFLKRQTQIRPELHDHFGGYEGNSRANKGRWILTRKKKRHKVSLLSCSGKLKKHSFSRIYLSLFVGFCDRDLSDLLNPPFLEGLLENLNLVSFLIGKLNHDAFGK